MTHESPEVLLDPELRAGGDVAHFWRLPRFHALECLRASFERYSYTRHTHETYAVAAIVEGCETFFHRGEQRYAPAGSVAVVEPDEVHDGAPHGGPFQYRTLYPTVELMREVAEDVLGRPVLHPPHFKNAIIQDPALMRLFVSAHACLERPDHPLLQGEELLLAFLGRLILRHADCGSPPATGGLSAQVGRARDYLDAHFTEEVELAELARIAGLSRTQLIRAFRREIGMTPHAYLIDRRFRAARRRLERGEPPAEVALACGFCDQSHLNRVFKARMRVTPGAYRAA